MTTNRYGASRDELLALLTSWGEPQYRADQLWEGLYEQRCPLADITNLSQQLRTRLAGELPYALEPVTEAVGDDGLTTKWLWSCTRDGAQIETVLMRYPTRATVCVSSQAGCAMGCPFCATGQAGFERHLDAGEMVEQVMRAAHASPRRVDNVVFMGMGEPLANYEPVLESVYRMQRDLGISARHITLSTIGVVPAMRRLAAQSLPVELAVSLHAATDELRDELVPLNRTYPLEAVLDAAREYTAAKRRRLTFEYACVAGMNDDLEQAALLASRLARFRPPAPHVNLIPLNPTAGFRGHAPNRGRMLTFARRLRADGVNATVRQNRGADIDAACGQLRWRRSPTITATDPSRPPSAGQNRGVGETLPEPEAT